VTRRVLLGLALIAAAVAGLDCDIVFPPADAPPTLGFTGCFRGAISEPAGAGELTIVLQRPTGNDNDFSLTGCLVGTDPAFQATLAGMVLEDQQTQARFTAMPQGRPSFVLLVERQPPEGGIASLAVVNESGVPFLRAQDLPRCAADTTCADLGVPLPFSP
jgi:hypothetical protein